MDRRLRHDVLVLIIVAITVSLFSSSCSSTEPIPRFTRPAVADPSRSSVERRMFDGWDDITSQSTTPSVTLWLVSRSYSASLLLRQFVIDDSTDRLLRQEDVCTIGQISMRLKMVERKNDRRITRIPERGADLRETCVYVYEEDGLLRRVVVFRSDAGVFEMEMAQEDAETDFRTLVTEQNNVLRTIQSGRSDR
jgi:hypothetical protein